jgi:hypothetical protein
MSTLADAYCEVGQFDKAVQAAERGLAINPSPASGGGAVGLRAELEAKVAKFKSRVCK